MSTNEQARETTSAELEANIRRRELLEQGMGSVAPTQAQLDLADQAEARLNAMIEAGEVTRQPEWEAKEFKAAEPDDTGNWAGAGVIIMSAEEIMHLGIEALVTMSGENSRAHGFHDDWPNVNDVISVDTAVSQDRQLGLAITEKLALIHEEVSEALGEIRSGHEPGKVYFTSKHDGSQWNEQSFDNEGTPQRKPEGFAVELADAMIRIADLAFLTGIDLPAAIAIKHQYNVTRPFKHGRKF